MQESQVDVARVQALQNNFEGYTNKKVETVILSRKVQVMVGYSTGESFKQMVSSK